MDSKDQQPGVLCPWCKLELYRRRDAGNILFCVNDGPIDEDQAVRRQQVV